jgi:hypothetical protein
MFTLEEDGQAESETTSHKRYSIHVEGIEYLNLKSPD